MLWECGQHKLEIGPLPLIMGILNVTPDSFSDGGRFVAPDAAFQRGMELAEEGAAIIDVGGESSRPGAQQISADEECHRVVPVIVRLRQHTDIPISIDTTKASVAEAALAAGADIVNDVSALTADTAMLPLVQSTGAGVVLMHMQGTPQTMQHAPTYQNAPAEIADWLADRLAAVERAGIPPTRVALDPGIGFGKSLLHNLEILRATALFGRVKRPVLIGASRKRFIGQLGHAPEPDMRLPGSLAALACAVYNGAHILRVHDVAASWQAARVAAAIREAAGDSLGEMEQAVHA